MRCLRSTRIRPIDFRDSVALAKSFLRRQALIRSQRAERCRLGAVVAFKGGTLALAQVLILSRALQIATFAAPFQLQLVVNQALYRSDSDLLTVVALGFGGLVVVQAAFEAIRNWALRVCGQVLTFQVTGNLIRHLLRLPGDLSPASDLRAAGKARSSASHGALCSA